jgi:lysozyme family protein
MSAVLPWTIAGEWILEAEGGYVDDPHDPGGETNFGISSRAYPLVDIKGLTPRDALVIYRRDYWQRLGLEFVPAVLAIATFDGAVNCGPETAIRLLQATLGVYRDGSVGPDTIRAAKALSLTPTTTAEVLTDYMARRADYYARLMNRDKYMHGWFRRLFRLQRVCLSAMEQCPGSEVIH